MTKKHFELIARAMATQQGIFGHKESCMAIALAMADTNTRFDKVRFLKACGVIVS